MDFTKWDKRNAPIRAPRPVPDSECVQCHYCDGVYGRSEVAPVVPGSSVYWCFTCGRTVGEPLRPEDAA